MVSSDEVDDALIHKRFEDLCSDLNMDIKAKDEAWDSFERIRTIYTLEGDGLHWLACAVYVSCRESQVPTVHGQGQVVEGNCVSLTRLLRTTKLSLIEFFKKMKKWADMANLPQKFRDKVDKLERNFAVSTVTFKKYEPIFLDIFKNPADDPPKLPKGRKQKRTTVSISEVFNLCWTTFVQVKGNFSAISDDLVNSYHLLLCCIDWFYANVLLSNRRDLLNPNFSGLPKNFALRDYRPPTDVPCIIMLLCEKHEGLQLEAKSIKEHWWKPHIKKLFDKKILTGRPENLMAILEIGNFEKNCKAINNLYEEYVLNIGDFDERIFLGNDGSVEIGTPARALSVAANEPPDRMQMRQNLWEGICDPKTVVPATPLTNRRYLSEKGGLVTPVSTATQSVSRLQTLLSGRKTEPSEILLGIFEAVTRNPQETIAQLIGEMGKVFCEKYSQPADDQNDPAMNFAKNRLQLGVCLYYRLLENILINEKKQRQNMSEAKCYEILLSLLEQEIFHRSLFAICIEIVIFSYNSQRIFPWIIEVYDIPSYHFYKVIEVLIRSEDGLSRDVVKHLNHVEEMILESLVWKSDSPLWEVIKQTGDIPTCEDVSLPSQLDRDHGSASLLSPPVLPALKRVANTEANICNSPNPICASDRFSSPVPARRQLFPASSTDKSTFSLTAKGVTNKGLPNSPVSFPMALIVKDGTQILIPVQLKSSQSPVKRKLDDKGEQAGPPAKISSVSVPNKPKRTGSFALFFRKVYHLASIRIRDLCERLEIDSTLCSQIWTCFEHCLVQHIDLVQDRHLDQLIMCSIYVVSKVTGKDRSFQDIMRCYRLQPQAESHVYRSVLLDSRKRSNEDGKGNAGRTASPAAAREERRARREKESELSSIRSSSTLPIPQPESQPPTPTRVAGAGTSFQFEDRGEDRGDLIKFYNTIYVNLMKNFATKFSPQNQNDTDQVILSPLPVIRGHHLSPRKVSNNHSVYVSPCKLGNSLITPQSRMLYCFNKSPARDLAAINTMIQKRENAQILGKRLPLAEDGTSASPAFHKRLEDIMNERQASNGTS